MKRISTNVVLLALSLSGVSYAANSVIVESKSVQPGANEVSVGVFIANDITLYRIVLPLEIRSTSGDAFIATSFSHLVTGRITGKLTDRVFLTDDDPEGTNTCSGPTSSTWHTPLKDMDFDDGKTAMRLWLETDAGGGGGDTLAAGSDGSPGSGTPSIMFTFGTNCYDGTFEIDTCCFLTSHFRFNEGGTGATFTKGVITIDPGLQACTCNDRPVDVNCDGVVNILDVSTVTGVAFGGNPEPSACCHGAAGTSSLPPPSGGIIDK